MGSPSRNPLLITEATPSFKSEGPLPHDMILQRRYVRPGVPSSAVNSFTHADKHLSLCATKLGAMAASSATRAPCGSPRDAADRAFFFLERDSDSDDAISRTPSIHRGRSGSGPRNHTRGGAIELSEAPAVKRTPPTSHSAAQKSLSLSCPPHLR
ncbi:hypothetical protein EI94DRAFT_1044763 [Lactarius quietus]|nr:hypothetical protein EI94DRAFT_1044763 [Lactarius quietus]